MSIEDASVHSGKYLHPNTLKGIKSRESNLVWPTTPIPKKLWSSWISYMKTYIKPILPINPSKKFNHQIPQAHINEDRNIISTHNETFVLKRRTRRPTYTKTNTPTAMEAKIQCDIETNNNTVTLLETYEEEKQKIQNSQYKYKL